MLVMKVCSQRPSDQPISDRARAGYTKDRVETACAPTAANGIDAIMSNGRNAHDQTYRNSATRRLRVDDMAAIVVRNSLGPAGNARQGMLPRGHSGRLMVISAGLTLLLIWGDVVSGFP